MTNETANDNLKLDKKEKIKKLIKENFKSGITVALVSVPLSIAIAIASGATPQAGIITAFWATIIASMFGGSRYNVVGPAGALTSVLFAATVSPSIGIDPNILLPTIAMLSGLMIFLVYILKFDKYVKLIPEVVVHGFAGGVAFVIAATQLKEAFGLGAVYKSSGEFLHDMERLISNLPYTQVATFLTFIFFFVFLIVWKKNVKNIPGVLPATVLGILFGLLTKEFEFTKQILTVGDKYGEMSLALINFYSFQVAETIFSNTGVFFALLKVSLVVCVISILETLITAKIGDSLTKTTFNPKKETFGLSLANFFSGLAGGLPATGVFIRTGLNIKSGATHNISSTICGLATGLGAIFLMPLFKYIPMSVISSMLMMTALGLIDVSHFKHLFKHNSFEFVVGVVTVVLVVVTDPLVAVASGALLYFLGQNKNKIYRFVK